MRLLRLWGVVVVATTATSFAACVGDDPTITPPGDDAGGSSPGLDATTTPGTDAAQAGDTSTTPGRDGSVADAADSSVFDAGPPQWTATLAAGTMSMYGNATDSLCAIDIVAIETSNAPPQYQLYLRKQDAAGATCSEPKGVRSLGSGYSTPAAFVLKPQASKQLVVVYSMKLSLSGSSPEVLTMKQIDWVTGNDLRLAQNKTKAVMGIPANASLHATQLFFGDQTEETAGTVRLKGNGGFPGETGTGMFFNCTFVSFFGSTSQPAAAADTCVGSDS